jgi:NADPH-dependent glutamate synthase beta subunit-like oxidoreductase
VARRLGAQVTIFSRRSAEAMPAALDAVAEARREGIAIEGLAVPSAIPTEAGRATGLTCRRVTPEGQPAAGAPEFFLPASAVIVAGKPDREYAGLEALRGESGAIATDEQGETKLPGTFAAADDLDLGIVSAALYRGRRAAETIHLRLRGLQPPAGAAPPVLPKDKLRLDYYPKAARTAGATLPAEERLQDPDREVALPLTAAQAVAEAQRCLSCGMCFACDTCWQYCQEQAIQKPVEQGLPYRIKLEFCTGCKKCAEQCPCGYIEMR